MDRTKPAFLWSNRQRAVPAREIGCERAAAVVDRAWSGVAAAARGRCALRSLEEVDFVLVSDRRIAALHSEFMGDPSATDVITFHHGEIVISAETARREALARGMDPSEELARYAVHGLLHLAGWSDATSAEAAAMRRCQEKILRRASRGMC